MHHLRLISIIGLLSLAVQSSFAQTYPNGTSETGSSQNRGRGGVSAFITDIGFYLHSMRMRNRLQNEEFQTLAALNRLEATVAENFNDERNRILNTPEERQRLRRIGRNRASVNDRISQFQRRFSPADISSAGLLIQFIEDEILHGAYTRQADRRRNREIARQLREANERVQQRIDNVLVPLTRAADVAVAFTAFTRAGFREAITAATGTGLLQRLNQETPLNVRAVNIWNEIVNQFNRSNHRPSRYRSDLDSTPEYDPGPGPFDDGKYNTLNLEAKGPYQGININGVEYDVLGRRHQRDAHGMF